MMQLVGRMQRKIRVPQHLTGQDDKISLARCYDGFGLYGVRNNTHRTRKNARSFPDPLGKSHLVSRSGRDLLMRYKPAG